MRIKNKKKILLTNYHNKLFTMDNYDNYDNYLELLFSEWEELEFESNNYKNNEAINIFLVYISYMLKNNRIIEKNYVYNDFDIDSID